MNTRIHLVTRLVALLVLLSFQPKVHAQVDTVPEFDPHYLHQYSEDSLMPYTDSTVFCDRVLHIFSEFWPDSEREIPTESAAVFYYPGNTVIYGIAVMIQDWIFKHVYTDLFEGDDSVKWNEQLKVYNPHDMDNPIASGTISLLNLDRYMKYKGCIDWIYFLLGDTLYNYIRLLQVEFDSPIIVKDTFVVSMTNEYFKNAIYTFMLEDILTYPISTMYKFGCLSTPYYDMQDACLAEQYPPQHFMYKYEQGNWVDSTAPCVMQIFPIIDLPGDTCPAVSNVHITEAYGSLVMAEWETATNNSRWEVSYGPVGTEPDSGTIITCMEPVAKILNLNVDSQYVAYVRPVCRFGITKRGEWSEGVVFNPLSGEVGIEQVADTEPLTMYPNPASGTVRIGLPEGQQGVDVRLYDMAGREVMRSTSLTLDVSHLPQGTYTVRAATATGTRTGRLVVAE